MCNLMKPRTKKVNNANAPFALLACCYSFVIFFILLSCFASFVFSSPHQFSQRIRIDVVLSVARKCCLLCLVYEYVKCNWFCLEFYEE